MWHYSPIYFIYLQIDKAEMIHKLIHFLLHTGSISIVVSMAYRYFRNDLRKAQIIAFILVSNEELRELNQNMFNDSILAFYILFCMYFVSKNKPIAGALCLSLSFSIKAGAILLFPGFLGWVQYQHGTIKLLVSIIILISFQLIIALPFYNNDAALALGFKQGADGNLADYVKNSKMFYPI